MRLIEAEQVRLRFGEWRGSTLGEVVRRDPAYLRWLLGESGLTLDFHLREAIGVCIEAADRGEGGDAAQAELGLEA